MTDTPHLSVVEPSAPEPSAPSPVDLAAHAVLSAAVWSDIAARRMLAEVPADVLSGPYATLHGHLTTLVDNGTPVSPQTVQVLAAQGPDPARTCATLVDLICDSLPADMIGWHIAVLNDEHRRRKLRALATTAAQMADADEPNPDLLRQRLDDALTVRSSAPPTVASLLDAHLADLDSTDLRPALPTGIHGLDRLLSGGLRGGQLVIVGARPSVGKSLMLLQIAQEAALRQHQRVLLASMEMGNPEVINRYLSSETKTDLGHLVGRQMTDRDWTVITNDLARLSEGHLHVVDANNQTVQGIAAQARSAGAQIVLVDYLALLKSTGRHASRQEEVGALSRSLKVLARDLDVPVVVAAQLNRKLHERKDPRPQLSDLRESGSIEADADVVILLHRDPDDEFAGTTAEAIVAKNRSGPLGTVDLAFHGHYALFEEQHRPPTGWADIEPEDAA